ncbi:hypothetical protein A2U01_0032328 [Trifolium medium]|uniref:Envelope-like protein n=1 Tax=Trifolium medium TaxID=97028 RepID=A0A392PGL6_9FABA|nr:hypothetical protein [Trifolium medium]
MTRKDVIAALKAHCKDLDEKKLQFEHMIQALEVEEVAEVAVQGEDEEGDEEEENADDDQVEHIDSSADD